MRGFDFRFRIEIIILRVGVIFRASFVEYTITISDHKCRFHVSCIKSDILLTNTVIGFWSYKYIELVVIITQGNFILKSKYCYIDYNHNI